MAVLHRFIGRGGLYRFIEGEFGEFSSLKNSVQIPVHNIVSRQNHLISTVRSNSTQDRIGNSMTPKAQRV